MIIIHIVEHLHVLTRTLEPTLRRALSVFPVVVVVGPRQVGKSTLARESTAAKGRLYLTLDEFELLGEARTHPERLLGRAPLVTIDEVQRAPELLLAMKREVDRQRKPGRFLVTGSADVRAMKGVADHLPGRAVYLHLEPLSVAELRGEPAGSGWSALVGATSASAARDHIADREPAATDLVDQVLRGGLPTAALLDDDDDRRLWFDGYVRAWLERGPADLGGVADLPVLRRLMLATAARLGGLMNQAEVGRDVGLARTTAHRHLSLLSMGLLLDLLPAYAQSRSVRVIKSPKVYWRDVGLAAYLVGARARRTLREERYWGALLENLVLSNLRAWASASKEPVDVHYWRTASGREVDFVVETEGRLVPMEVKSGRRVVQSDLAHMEEFLSIHRKRAKFGVVLYDGPTVETPAENIVAVPIARVC